MHVRATTYIYLAAFMLLLYGTKAKARDKGYYIHLLGSIHAAFIRDQGES